MTALHAKSLTELRAGLEAGDFSSVEVTQTLLDRIAVEDDKLNALIEAEIGEDKLIFEAPKMAEAV